MGVHISQIRSLTLDRHIWDDQMISFIRAIGNDNANKFWESRVESHSSFKKITPDSSKEERSAFIKHKYQKKGFIPDLDLNKKTNLDEQLMENFLQLLPSMKPYQSDFPRSFQLVPTVMLQLLCLGASIKVKDKNGDTILHHLSKTKLTVFAEWVIRSGADIDALNSSGFSPLAIAIACENTEMSDFLKLRGSHQFRRSLDLVSEKKKIESKIKPSFVGLKVRKSTSKEKEEKVKEKK